MRFNDNEYMVVTMGNLKISNIKPGSSSDIEQPINSLTVKSDSTGGFTGSFKLNSGKQYNFIVDKFIYDSTSVLYTKLSGNSGVNLYITTGLHAMIMAKIHELVLNARIASTTNVTQKYALTLSKDRLTGILQSLGNTNLLNLSIVSNAFGLDTDGYYYTSSQFLPLIFDSIQFPRVALTHQGHVLDLTGSDAYIEAVRSAVADSQEISDIRAGIHAMAKIPDEIHVAVASPLIAKILSSRRSLELCFAQMLAFDVWPSEMQLSTHDSMPAYIKGRLYKLALDNRTNVQSVVTQGQHESMSSFLADYKNIASFLSNAIYPLQDTSKVNGRMSYIEKVLQASNKTEVSSLFDSRITTGDLNSIKSDLKNLAIIISLVLCDNGSVKINTNGTADIRIPVYESAFLTYYQSGLVKIAYRS